MKRAFGKEAVEFTLSNHIIILDDPGGSDLTPLSTLMSDLAGDDCEVTLVTHKKDLKDALAGDNDIRLVIIEDLLEGNPRGGLETVVELRRTYKDLPLVVAVEQTNPTHGSELIEAGATDFLFRGDNFRPLIRTQMDKINRIVAMMERNRELEERFRYLSDMERSRYRMIGNSPQIMAVQEKIRRVSRIPRPVLITGERGTGKELVAHAIHDESGDNSRPLIVVNCAAFSDSLLESELFGYEPGAFTGASKRNPGKFELADKGTLFLDEIGNMSLDFQQKIMRVVEYGTFRRVGGNQELRVNTRIVAATNADLKKSMEDGKFMRDLYDRLTFEEINMPPLRDRQGDVEILARFFLHRFMEEIPEFKGKHFTKSAYEALKRYRFPGNVRELKNIVERAVYRGATNDITPEDLGLQFRPEEFIQGETFKEKTEAYECHLIREALTEEGGNQAGAARYLGLSYHQLRYFMKKYADRLE
ncbi:MAG: sigma-54 dependent transcriptional regulator [Acidobacteriota bacterium]|nr:sigma-54 dependent transcriptional regulator [Acidobacteriota bacterium]